MLPVTRGMVLVTQHIKLELSIAKELQTTYMRVVICMAWIAYRLKASAGRQVVIVQIYLFPGILCFIIHYNIISLEKTLHVLSGGNRYLYIPPSSAFLNHQIAHRYLHKNIFIQSLFCLEHAYLHSSWQRKKIYQVFQGTD